MVEHDQKVRKTGRALSARMRWLPTEFQPVARIPSTNQGTAPCRGVAEAELLRTMMNYRTNFGTEG